MNTFEYPLFAKIIYRFANIPISLILIFYIIVGLFSFNVSWMSPATVVVYSLMLILLNRFYYRSYKSFPYKIEIDNEKMICSDFFMTNSKLEIKLVDIESIRGGVFSSSLTKPVYLKCKSLNKEIGFHYHLKNYNKLVTIILSNINQELYNELLQKIQNRAEIKREKRKRKF